MRADQFDQRRAAIAFQREIRLARGKDRLIVEAEDAMSRRRSQAAARSCRSVSPRARDSPGSGVVRDDFREIPPAAKIGLGKDGLRHPCKMRDRISTSRPGVRSFLYSSERKNSALSMTGSFAWRSTALVWNLSLAMPKAPALLTENCRSAPRPRRSHVAVGDGEQISAALVEIGKAIPSSRMHARYIGSGRGRASCGQLSSLA